MRKEISLAGDEGRLKGKYKPANALSKKAFIKGIRERYFPKKVNVEMEKEYKKGMGFEPIIGMY